jgi:metallo-beta-lactamase family protein
LQEEEAEYRNRHNLTRHQPALPLYTEEDARAALKLIQVRPNTGEPLEVAEGVKASFRVAGHILGSSLVLLELEGAGDDGAGRRVLFSGDLGHYHQPIIRVNLRRPPARSS